MKTKLVTVAKTINTRLLAAQKDIAEGQKTLDDALASPQGIREDDAFALQEDLLECQGYVHGLTAALNIIKSLFTPKELEEFDKVAPKKNRFYYSAKQAAQCPQYSLAVVVNGQNVIFTEWLKAPAEQCQCEDAKLVYETNDDAPCTRVLRAGIK